MYFETVGIRSAAIAKLVLVLLWGMILVGRMGCAYMSKTTSSSKLLIMIGLVFSGFFALLLAAQTTALCIVALLGIGLSMAGIYPTTISTLKQATTATTGACIAIARTGGVIMPGIVGYVGNLLGMACGMAAVLVALGGMVFCMSVNLWMDKTVDPFHGAGESK